MISTEQASKLLMISPARLGQLVKAGYIEKASKDVYNIVAVVQGYIKFLKADERRASKTATQSLVQQERAKALALQNAETEARLIEIDEVDALFDESFGRLRTVFLGLPARMTRDPTMRRKIEDEIHGAFVTVSDDFKQASEVLRTSGTILAAEPEDDA